MARSGSDNGQTRGFAFIDVLRGIAILTVVVHHLPEAFGQVRSLDLPLEAVTPAAFKKTLG